MYILAGLTSVASGTMYSASFASSSLTMSAASPTSPEGAGREGCGGTTTCEHSATVMSGRAMRHSCKAISTSFGDGLRVMEYNYTFVDGVGG